MFRKIFCTIIAVVMACSVLSGCKLVTLDEDHDARRVVMTVSSYEIEGYNATTKEKDVFVTEEYKVYKAQYENVYNNYALMYEQYYGMDHDEVAEQLFRDIAVERIVLNLANAYISFGYFDLDTYEYNTVNKNVYAAIDELIDSYATQILEENGKIVATEEEESESESETTYPVKEVETDSYAGLPRDTLVELCIERGLLSAPAAGDDAAQDKIDAYTHMQLKQMLIKNDRKGLTKWAPSLAAYPGLFEHDAEARSLRLEAFSRALAEMKRQALDMYDLTDEDKQKIEADYKKFDEITKTQGLSYVYGALGESHVVYLLVAESYVNEQKLALLEEYITGTVEVSTAEVEKEYETLLADQKASFSASVDAYASNINAYSTNLYFPTDNYFFVKHVLIPFSDAQTTALNEYKTSINNTLYGDYLDYRDRLAEEITSYEHVDGEDYGDPIGINEIYNEIYAAVNGAVTLRDKERAFDDLIYKYNTDPGIFNTMYGYVELYDLGTNTEQYVEEFAAAARELYEGGVEGAVSGKVVTDYGVHVLYLTKMPKAGEVLGLYDYITYAENKTVFDELEASLITKKESAVFSTWQKDQIVRYYEADGVVTIDEKPLKELFESHNHEETGDEHAGHDHSGHNH